MIIIAARRIPFIGPNFNTGINAHFMPFANKQNKGLLCENCFYADVGTGKVMIRFYFLLMKAIMNDAAQEHFQSYKGNAGTPFHNKNPFQDGIFP